MEVDCMTHESLDNNFSKFVIKLLDYFSLEEVCSNIFKSPFVNLSTVEMLYDIICKSNYINSNLCLNILFTKTVQYNIGNQIDEQKVETIIDKIDIVKFNNHQCSYNYHNYRITKCEFSIYSSFPMCLYYYVNDIHLMYNSYVSEKFIKKYISEVDFNIFKKNIYGLSNAACPSIGDSLNHNKNDNLEHLLSLELNSSLKQKISLNNGFMWEDIEKIGFEKIDISYIFLNNFSHQKREIQIDTMSTFIKYKKIYRWLQWVYWNPRSGFRIRKMEREFERDFPWLNLPDSVI